MVKSAEEHAEEDKKRRELVETKNQAEALIHATEKTLTDAGDKVDQAQRSAAEEAIEALKQASQGEDVDDIRAKSETLAQASMKLGEALYAESQAGEADGTGGDGTEGDGTKPGDGAGNGQDDTVVDADFEEVDDDKKGTSA
jgi:molecular chaperone DnaK